MAMKIISHDENRMTNNNSERPQSKLFKDNFPALDFKVDYFQQHL